MATRPLIKESLQMLDLCGLRPGNQNIRTILQIILQVTIYLYLFIDIELQLVYNWDGLTSMDGITEMAMFYQIFVRIPVVLFYKKVFARIFFKFEKFWPFDKFGNKVKLEIVSILTSSKKNITIFVALFATSAAVYIAKPLFAADKILPILTYHPTDRTKSPQYELAYCLHIGVMLYGSCAILGFDVLFISFIIYIVAELKIIKQGFLTLKNNDQDNKSCLNEIKALVDHHNLVLECIKDLDKIYSLMLLNQFLTSLVCICGGLLGLIDNGFPPDLQHFLKYLTFVITMLSQLFIYCVAGSYLITESESVSAAVFESDWWVKTQPEVRRAYVMVIQRANKTEKLTVGGMFILDLESFTSVVRTSLSFFTLVQAMYTRTDQSRI